VPKEPAGVAGFCFAGVEIINMTEMMLNLPQP
jgi:hypothetical protein